ncbi:MAG: LapA family protein [Gammaproteobacteria bacterium]|nr:LapA family protein [Gammaproteobacteria bacterium]
MSHTIKKYFSIILLLLIFIVSLVFFLKNNQMITFNYLVDSQDISLSFLLFISLSIGALLGILAWLPKIIGLKHRISKLEKQMKLSEKELDNLRVMPMKDTL